MKMSVIDIFVYLQVLDFLSTLAGFSLGASEVSPFIAKLIHVSSPVWGLALSKIIGLGMGAFCVATNRTRLVGWINYWYAGLVVWNLCIIVLISQRLVH